MLTHCRQCWLSQLTVAVDPVQLYRDYHYISGMSTEWVQHCDRLVDELALKKRFVVEIASNDGTLLRRMKDAGASVLGVEPAANLTRHYPPSLPYLPDFFTQSTAGWITTRYGHADVVVAQNVIGHVDDIRGFLYAVGRILNKRRGLAILEAPYLYRMLATQEFPQIYHEHLSYWSLSPLRRLAKDVGLEVIAVKPLDVHGGSMRYYLRHDGSLPHRSVEDLTFMEAQLQSDPTLYTAFTPQKQIAEIEAALERHRGKVVWGYGASAKGTVLLNTLKNADIIQCVVDDYTGKRGRYIPGVHIPIVAPQDLSHVDVVVVLAWNWSRAIEVKAETQGFGSAKHGEFLLMDFTPPKPKRGQLSRIA